MGMHFNPLRHTLLVSAVALTLGLSACSDNDDDSATINLDEAVGTKVAIATRAANYSSGRVDLHDVATGELLLNYPATLSDIDVATDGSHVYQIGRFQMDHITKFSVDSSEAIYQYSVNGEESGANPYQIVFASENKAYVIRYGSDKIWIINPNADSDAGFKIGELDISAYDTDSPNANSAVLKGDKLFVLIERLDGFDPVKQGYIAVFDTTTDTEINTGMGTADNLLGIAIGVVNPRSLQYVDANGLLYVVGRGNFFGANGDDGDRYSGGIVTIDPDSYNATMLLDDGTEEENQGFFTGNVVISSDTAYLFSYTGGYTGSTTLRRYNATTGTLADGSIAGLADMELTTLGRAPDEQLWVGVSADAPYIDRIDLTTDASVGTIQTELVPKSFVFIE